MLTTHTRLCGAGASAVQRTACSCLCHTAVVHGVVAAPHSRNATVRLPCIVALRTASPVSTDVHAHDRIEAAMQRGALEQCLGAAPAKLTQ